MSKNRFILTCLGLILMLTACSSNPAPGGQEDDLTGTAWQATYPSGGNQPLEPLPTVNFSNGQVQGTTGCNSYGGEYEITGPGEIRFMPLAVTEMACIDPGVMEQEAQFLQFISQVSTYQRGPTTLTLSTPEGVSWLFKLAK